MMRGLLSLVVTVAASLFSVTGAQADCSGSGTAWTCTTSSTPTQIQSMLNNASFSDGAVVTFTAGSGTWGGASGTFRLLNTKGWTFICETVQACVITIGGSSVCCSDGDFSGDNNKLYRFSGFVFQNAPTGSNVFIFYGTSGSIARQVRFDHNWFKDFGTDCIMVGYGGFAPNSQVFGLFDNNTITGLDNSVVLKALGVGIDATVASGWSSLYNQTARGTINNVFVEDNTITFTNLSNFGAGCIDAWAGAAMVFRFNTVKNCQVVVHGTIHYGGPMNFEAYGNVIERDNGAAAGIQRECYRCIYHQGSMESYFWGNRLVHSAGPINSEAISMTHYRSSTPATAGYDDPPGRCDGSRAWDGNTSPSGTYYGYPCWLQPGRTPTGGSPRWGTLAPIYVWGNVDASTENKIDLLIVDPFGTTGPSVLDHIVANRDFYNAVSASPQSSPTSPFNGTTGMGFGSLANRPTACTHTTSPDGDDGGGVGYWATDQGNWNQSSGNPYGVQQSGADGILYRCSATNTWVTTYTPYTYPHPLQGAGGGGSPPGRRMHPRLNLRVELEDDPMNLVVTTDRQPQPATMERW